MADALEKSAVDGNGDDMRRGRTELSTSTEDEKQIKEIEESVKRLRRQRFQVEQLKQASLEKDTKIEELQAELLVQKQDKNRHELLFPANANNGTFSPSSPNIVHDGSAVHTSPEKLQSANDGVQASMNGQATNRYAGIPKLIARFREEVQTLQQEKHVLQEQVKLLKSQQDASRHEYTKTLEAHKELEVSLRREIDLSEKERKAESKGYAAKLQELEKQFAESRIAAMNVEREKQQIGDELKSAILSMEDVQSAQQMRAEQLEQQVTKLTYHKEDSDKKLKEVMKSSSKYIEVVHKLEMEKNNLLQDNETLKTLNDDLKGKVKLASETIEYSNMEMEKQRKLVAELVDEVKSEKQKRESAENLMQDAEQEVRVLRAELESSHRTLGELRVLGEVLQVRTREVEDREAKSRKELMARISHLENALESERDNRRQWANARVQLLQEFCQEEGKLREVIDGNNAYGRQQNSYTEDFGGGTIDYFGDGHEAVSVKGALTTPSPSPRRQEPAVNFQPQQKDIFGSDADPMKLARTSASVLAALGKAHARKASNELRSSRGNTPSEKA